MKQTNIAHNGPGPALLHVPRGDLQPNPWNRKNFNAVTLQELADSIKAQGIIQPLIVREITTEDCPTFEIIAGERRWRAAELAQLDLIPCLVRELDDRAARELCAIENLQREDLTALEEAQGYADLLKECQCKVEDLEERLGRKRSHIYARLRLLTLPEAVKKALGEGKIEASVADLIATIPDPQKREEALEEVMDNEEYDREAGKQVPVVMSFRAAKGMIEADYRKPLKDALFDLKAEGLAGEVSCEKCPRRTGNIPGLPNGSAPNVCTAPACYGRKFAAHTDALLAKAKAAGKTVLEGKDAAKLWQYGSLAYGSGYQRADETKWHKEKNVLITTLLGKKMPAPAYAVNPQGEVVPIYKKAEVQAALVAAKLVEPPEKVERESAADVTKRKVDEQVEHRTLILAATQVVQPVAECKHLDRLSSGLLLAFVRRLAECDMVNEDLIMKRRGWAVETRFADHAKKLLPSELMGLLTEMFLIEDPYSSGYDDQLLKEFATILGVKLDLKAIEKAVRAELKAQEKAVEQEAAKGAEKGKLTPLAPVQKQKAAKAAKPTKPKTKAKK